MDRPFDTYDPANVTITGGTISDFLSINNRFTTVANLLADTTLTYTAGSATSVVAGDYIEAQGFRYQVADSAATDHHVITAGGVKLYVQEGDDGSYNVLAFGAVGDGQLGASASDDTSAIQSAIQALPVGGVLYGAGKIYAVKNLWIKSDMSMRDFRFLEIAGSLDDFSPINIGNDLTTVDGSHDTPEAITAYNTSQVSPGISSVTFKNVHVDGNRSNQTHIDYNTEPGVLRDGGRHGFVSKGYCTNIKFLNCSATYCGTDGVLIYRGLHAIVTTDATQIIQDITFENCRFEWNRRHGGASDSINNGTWTNCIIDNNGQDINGGLVIGDVGAKVGANRYGNGWSMEGYGIGSRNTNIKFNSCRALQNVRDGLLFYDPVDPLAANFLPRKNITINSCNLDIGTEHQNGEYATTFTSSIASAGNGPVYEDVIIDNCILGGSVLFRSVDAVTVSNCIQNVPTSSYRMALDYGTNIKLRNLSSNVVGYSVSNSDYTDDVIIRASTTWDPGTIAAGAKATIAVPAPNATYGMYTRAGLTTLNTVINAGLILSSFVVFPQGSIQVTITNPTAGALTVSPGTLTVSASLY